MKRNRALRQYILDSASNERHFNYLQRAPAGHSDDHGFSVYVLRCKTGIQYQVMHHAGHRQAKLKLPKVPPKNALYRVRVIPKKKVRE